jgi:putative SOS response-associated peptidase YedK
MPRPIAFTLGINPVMGNDSSAAASMINARSETAATLPSFREPFRFRRCLVPTDGFYEWKRVAMGRQPFCFDMNDGELFAFAGLWDCWRGLDNQWIRSFAILTTTPNALTSPIHDRMPVILAKEDYDLWLDPGMSDVQVISELLRPYDASRMQCYPVSSRVNQVQNDDAECSAPVPLESPAQRPLFG